MENGGLGRESGRQSYPLRAKRVLAAIWTIAKAASGESFTLADVTHHIRMGSGQSIRPRIRSAYRYRATRRLALQALVGGD
jgi:hypothetical protein